MIFKVVDRGTKDGYSTATVKFLKDNLPDDSELEALQVGSNIKVKLGHAEPTDKNINILSQIKLQNLQKLTRRHIEISLQSLKINAISIFKCT